MTMQILKGDQRKAERIARELVSTLTVADLDWVITDSMTQPKVDRLCAAVDLEYRNHIRQMNLIDSKLRDQLTGETLKEFKEFARLSNEQSFAYSTAGFHLGYFTALRLLGVEKKPKARRRR